MSTFTVGTAYGPAVVVDAADHFRDSLGHLLPARTHLPPGLVLNAKARHAALRVKHVDLDDQGDPDAPAQTVQIWVTSTTHPDHPGNTYGTTWLLLTYHGLPPVAIAFTVLAGHPKKKTPALAQTPTQFELIHDLMPGIRGWLSGPETRADPTWVPWRVLGWVQKAAVTVADQPPPAMTPREPMVGSPASVTSVLTWASVGVQNQQTINGFLRLKVIPDGYFRATDGVPDADIVLSFFEQAHQKLIPIIEAQATAKRWGRSGRPTWKQWRPKALDLAATWAYGQDPAPADWADRMYTPQADPMPVGYVKETFAYGWTASEAARFWMVHKTVCPRCQSMAINGPGALAEHGDDDLPLMGWAPMKVGARDASRYMLAGLTPADVKAWAWNATPTTQTLAVSAALIGFDVNAWDHQLLKNTRPVPPAKHVGRLTPNRRP